MPLNLEAITICLFSKISIPLPPLFPQGIPFRGKRFGLEGKAKANLFYQTLDIIN
jgi:hypothetical protein